MDIRHARIETDLPGILSVINACDPDHPESLERLRANFENNTPGRISLRLVAVDEAGAVIGYCPIIHVAEAPEYHFYVWIGIAPAFRGLGLGATLWEASLAFLKEQTATRIGSEVADTNPSGLEFARRRGFKIDRQHFYSVLDLTAFDEKPYLPSIAALEAQGIRFCSLADFPDTPGTLQKFYELNLAVVRDIPGEDWDFDHYPGFFEKYILGSPRFNRAGQLLAVDGDEMVGLAAVNLCPEKHSAYNATTGVIRPYRGRGIALALKVLSALYARQHGAQLLDTENDSLNVPILAINRRLGYQPQPGVYQLVRWLNE